MNRIFNFGAGPAMLPTEVMEKAQEEFLNYRNMGIFHEHVTNMILDDFKSACNPKKITVTASFGTRGGIDTIVKSSWPN